MFDPYMERQWICDYDIYHIVDQRRSDEPAHPRSLTSLRCSHTSSKERVEGFDKNQTCSSHWMAAHARLKNEFTEDEKYHNPMAWFYTVTLSLPLPLIQEGHLSVTGESMCA